MGPAVVVGDAEVVRFLQRVGVSERVAPIIAHGGEILRRLSAVSPEGTEYAAVLDAATGASVGHHIRGAVTGEIDITPLLARARSGRSYIAIHTHPADSTFSLHDARAFVETPQLSVLLAVAGDGRWYSFTGGVGVARAREAVVRRRWAREVVRLEPGYTQRILRGEISADDALVAMQHELWEVIAEAIGVRYDWTE